MNLIQVNYVAVVLAALATMVVGFIWYSKAVFGKQWMGLVGIKAEDMKKGGSAQMYIIPLVGSLVMAYVLSHFIHYAGAYSIVNGAKTGVWAWLGFVAPATLVNTIFAKRPIKLFYIDAGYVLINLIVMGAILAVMY